MRRVLGLILVGCVPSSFAAGAEPYFMGIGDLPGGWYYSSVDGLSGDGRVVVGESWGSGPNAIKAIRWTMDEGMQILGPVNNFIGGVPEDASYDGSVIVGDGTRLNGRGEGWRWTAQTGLVGVGDLPGGAFKSLASAVSADGSVVVGWSESELSTPSAEAYRWTAAGGMVALGDLPGGRYISAATDISADASVIVGISSTRRGSEAFRWTSETGMVVLGGELPGGVFAAGAFTISADGQTIVGNLSDDRYTPFRWTEEEGLVALPHPFQGQYTSVFPHGVSADGSVIVGQVTGPNERARGFIWDAERGTRDLEEALVNEFGLNLDGWRLNNGARAISDDGRTIVGSGQNREGNPEGWVAYLGPPPQPCLADLTGDRTIDERDLMALLESFGLDAGGDTDNDADTDLTDLAVLLSNYGMQCP